MFRPFYTPFLLLFCVLCFVSVFACVCVCVHKTLVLYYSTTVVVIVCYRQYSSDCLLRFVLYSSRPSMKALTCVCSLLFTVAVVGGQGVGFLLFLLLRVLPSLVSVVVVQIAVVILKY